MTQHNIEDLYRIGTVASLTGISIECLRAWERRYGLTPAQRSGRTRFYSRDQLEKLKLIKRLTDQGQAISSLTELSFGQLQQRISDQPDEPVLVPLHNPNVGLVGPNLLTLEQQTLKANTRMRIQVTARWANMEAFTNERDDTSEPHILVLQIPVLSSQPVDNAKNLYPSARVIVLYQFATAQAISQAAQAGTTTLKWPAGWPEIEQAALSGGLVATRAGQAAPRRFSDEELIAIAATSEDPSQCPEHIIEAIHQINALSTFIRQSNHEGKLAHLYERAHVDASNARAQLEMALETLISEDNQSIARAQGLVD